MSATLPVPKDLRPQLVQRLEKLDDAGLVFVHNVLLHAEKEQLWRQLSEDFEQDRQNGAMDQLPEIIREVRSKAETSSK